MVVRRLQPKIARHLIGVSFTYFTLLTSILFSVERVLLEFSGQIVPLEIIREEVNSRVES